MITKKFWVILVAGLLLLGVTGMVLGQDSPKSPQPSRMQAPFPDPAKLNAEFGKGLDELVVVKAITAQQKNEIVEYFEKAFKDHNGMEPAAMEDWKRQDHNPINLLVKDSIINQDQAAVVARIFRSSMPLFQMGPRFGGSVDPEKRQAIAQQKLEDLVHSKVITDQQKEAILKFFKDNFDTRREQKFGIESKREQAGRAEGKDFLSMLVQSGVLNQKQTDAIIAIAGAMPRPEPGDMGMMRGWGPDHQKNKPDPDKLKADLQKNLDSLVRSNMITDKQKDVIIKYYSDRLERMKARKLENGPGKDEVFQGPEQSLELLVQKGTITQEQAEAIRKALSPLLAPMNQVQSPEQPQP
jgi:hypothetical protein